MRVPRPTTVTARVVWLCLLLVFALGTPTLLADPPAPAPAPPWSDAARLAVLFDEALGLVEQECGAPFVKRPTLHVATRAEIRAIVREDVGPLAKALELDAKGLDGLAEVLSQAAMGLYQDGAHIVHIVPENMLEVPALVTEGQGFTEAELRLLLVHEGTHAWDWERFPLEAAQHAATTGDELRALAAVAEGHAQLVTERVAQKQGATPAFVRLTGWITSPPIDVPEGSRLVVDAVTAYASFAYVEGLTFLRAIFAARGHEGVAAVLRAPPKAPDVIEHPERWLTPEAGKRPDLGAVIAVLRALVPEPSWESSTQSVPTALLRSQAPRIPESHRATFLDGFASAQLLLGSIEAEGAQLIAMALAFDTPAQADHFLEAERLASVLTPERLPDGAQVEKDVTTLGAGRDAELPGFVLERVLLVGAERVTLQMHAARLDNVALEINLVNTPWLDRATQDAVLARVALALSDPAAAAAAPALSVPSVVRKGRLLRLNVTGPDGSPVPRASVRVVYERGDVEGEVVDGACELALPTPDAVRLWVFAAQDADGRPLPLAPVAGLHVPAGSDSLEVRLEQGLEIKGRVEARDGAPLDDVDVVATPIERRGNTTHYLDWALARARVAPDGGFRLVGLGQDTYTLALMTGEERASLSETEARGGQEDVVLGLRPPSVILVTVLGPDAQPVPRAAVQFHQVSPGEGARRARFASTHTNREGVARLEGLYPELPGTLMIDPPDSRAFLARHRQRNWSPVEATVTLERGWKLRGQVRDVAGSPAHARISLREGEHGTRSLRSEPDGTFEIPHLPLGPAEVRAEPIEQQTGGFHDDDDAAPWTRIEQGGQAELVVGTARTAVRLLVLDGEGRPVPQAKVTLARQSSSSITSIEAGRFDFRAPEGLYDIHVTQAADPSDQPLPLGPASRRGLTQRDGTLEIRLPSGRRVRGQLRNADGEPVADAVVRAERVASKEEGFHVHDRVHGRTRTGADGWFEVVTLGEGEYDLHVEASEDAAEPLPTRVTSGAEDVEIRLPKAHFFVLTVVDEDGTPVASAFVKVIHVTRPEPGTEHYQHMKGLVTAADGTARIGPVSAEEEVVLEVGGPAGREALRGARVVVKPPRDTSLTLERGFVATGLVLDSAGEPVAGARIHANDVQGSWEGLATTGADGTFRTKPLPMSGAHLHASSPANRDPTGQLDSSVVAVSPDKPSATLRFPGPPATLRLHVVGGAAAGRWVRLEREQGEDYHGTRALKLDADGRLEVKDLPAGPYSIWIPTTEHEPTCAFRSGIEPSDGPVELTLEPGQTIRARVRVPPGTKHVEVSVLGPLGQALGTTEIEPGLHEGRGLPAGTWAVHVKARAPTSYIYAKVPAEAGGEVEVEPKPR